MFAYNIDYKRYLALYLILLISLTVLSAYNEHILKWVAQAIWVIVGIPLLLLTFRRFPLTHITYFFILLHMCILLTGAHYTYQKVPLGLWFQDWFELSRNHFDRVGHFAQGFVPALIVREVLIRRSCLQPGKWLFFLVVCVCMAISMVYEFLEWAIAIKFGKETLAMQGDIWDTQWDMLMATVGAILAQVLFRNLQDKQLNKMHAH